MLKHPHQLAIGEYELTQQLVIRQFAFVKEPERSLVELLPPLSVIPVDAGLLVVDGELIERPVLRTMQRVVAIADRLSG